MSRSQANTESGRASRFACQHAREIRRGMIPLWSSRGSERCSMFPMPSRLVSNFGRNSWHITSAEKACMWRRTNVSDSSGKLNAITAVFITRGTSTLRLPSLAVSEGSRNRPAIPDNLVSQQNREDRRPMNIRLPGIPEGRSVHQRHSPEG